MPRSFVHFVLEPIYKVFTKTLTGEADQIARMLKEEFGVDTRFIKNKEYQIDIDPLLNFIIRKCFPRSCATLVDTMNGRFVDAATGTR